MELRIDQNVLDRFPNLNVTKENDVVTVKFNEGNGNSDFLFPLNFPLHNLDSLSWSRIDEIGRAGKAKTLFALGATKKDYMKNGFVAEWQIIGFEHDDLAGDSGKAPISWDLVSLYKDEIYMKKNSESACWESSDGRTYLNIDFFENMSDELQAIVKPVWKYTADASNTGKIIRTKDSIWVKSEKELYGRCFYSYDGEGHWYEFYAQEGIDWFKLNCEGNKDWQWLRSVCAGGTNFFCRVYTDGSASYNSSGRSRGVAPGFCS